MLESTQEVLAGAIGRIPSGCAILTAQDGDQATGMLASWVQQAAFDPPAVTVAVKKGRPIAGMLDSSNRFVLNVMGEDANAMFKHFGKGFGPDEDAFVGVETEQSDYGPLLTACIVQLGCAVSGKLDAGDHDVYLGRVEQAAGGPENKPYVHIRKNGLGY